MPPSFLRQPIFLLLSVTALALIILAVGTLYAPYLETKARGAIRREAVRQERRAVAGTETLEGTIEILHADFFDEGRSEDYHQLRTDDGEYFTLQLSQEAARKLPSGARVRLQGRKVNQFSLRVDTVETLPSRPPGSQSPHVRGARTEKKVAVILLNFENDIREPFTPEAVEAAMFTDANSVSAYFQESSFGQLSLTGDVFGWYTIPAPPDSVNCDANFSSWEFHAVQQALAAGVNLSNYDYRQLVVPRPLNVAGCAGGYGRLHGIASAVILHSNSFSRSTSSHELGHNFGLHHANAYSCADTQGNTVPLNNQCNPVEYGDPFNVMGQAVWMRQLHNYHKNLLAWLDPPRVVNVTESGEYTLFPIEQATPAGAHVLRLPVGNAYDYIGETVGSTKFYDHRQYMYLEYRQPLGIFDNFLPTHHVVNGVSVRLAPQDFAQDTYNRPFGGSYLVDADPQHNGTALPVGQSLTDPISGVTVTAMSLSPTHAVVRIALAGEEPTAEETPATVNGAFLFYNNSSFDSGNPAANTNDVHALAPDKNALLPGQPASRANISGYSRGINGLIIDSANLPADGSRVDTTDFEFRIGNTNNPAAWAPAPAPASIVVRGGAGVQRSDRIHITFPDGAIKNTWLAVTLKANADTGLAEPYTFFFASAVGDTGFSFAPAIVGTDAADLQAVGRNLTPADRIGQEQVFNPYDLNKDRTVDAFDLQVVARNIRPNILNLITPQIGP